MSREPNTSPEEESWADASDAAPVTERLIVDSPEMLAEEGAHEFVDAAEEAIAERGVFHVVLAGGSTPRALYQTLTEEPFRDDVEWDKVRFYFGDERCVPSDHVESNFRMARETLLGPLEIPKGQVFAMPGEIRPISEGAAAYQQTLEKIFGSNALTRFDLVILGLGEDGHTASLMPGSDALNETVKWVTSIEASPKPPPERLTLTYPILNAARRVMFVVGGAGKAAVVAEILEGESPEKYPAAAIRPTRGTLLWMLDAEAATELDDNAPETFL